MKARTKDGHLKKGGVVTLKKRTYFAESYIDRRIFNEK